MSDLISMLEVASRDDRLADGMLYRKAADRIMELTLERDEYKAKFEWAAGKLREIADAKESGGDSQGTRESG